MPVMPSDLGVNHGWPEDQILGQSGLAVDPRPDQLGLGEPLKGGLHAGKVVLGQGQEELLVA